MTMTKKMAKADLKKSVKLKSVKLKTKALASRILSAMNTEGVDNLVQAIKDDHKDLRKFIAKMKEDGATLSEKRAAAKSFMDLLKSHAPSEEKALYERCLKVSELRVMADEGFVEHSIADQLMKSIPSTKDKDRWLAKVKVLAELVEHHIEEEEEEFLPKVEKHFATAKKEKMAQEFYLLRKKSQRSLSQANAGVLRDTLFGSESASTSI